MWHAGIFSPGYFSTDDSEDDAVPAGEAGRYALVMLCPSSGSRGGGGGGSEGWNEDSRWRWGREELGVAADVEGDWCVRRSMLVLGSGLAVINVFDLVEAPDAVGVRAATGLLDMAGLIERAREVHMVDSALAVLADSLDLANVRRRVLYKTRVREGRQGEAGCGWSSEKLWRVYKQDWEVKASSFGVRDLAIQWDPDTLFPYQHIPQNTHTGRTVLDFIVGVDLLSSWPRVACCCLSSTRSDLFGMCTQSHCWTPTSWRRARQWSPSNGTSMT